MASGVRDVNLTLGSKIAVLVLALGTQSCLAWTLGAAGYGSYAVAMLFLVILSLVFMIGCETAGVYFVASKKMTLSAGLIHTSIMIGIGSVAAIVAGLVVLELPLSFVPKASWWAFRLALLGIPITAFTGVFTKMLTSIGKFYWFAVVSVIHSTTQLLLVFLFVGLLSWGVEGALLALLAAGMVSALVAANLFCRRNKLNWVRPSPRVLWEMFHYGLRYYAGKLSNAANLRLGTLVLALFASKSEIGLFAVAASLPSKVWMIPNTLSAVLLPRVARDDAGRSALVAQCARLSGVACGTLLLILVICARPIVAMLFSPDFLPAVPLVRIIALGVFVRGLCKVFGAYLIWTNHPGLQSIAVISGAVTNLVLLWLLLPMMGLVAAAISMTAGYFVMSAIMAERFSRLSGIKKRQMCRFCRSDWNVLLRFVPHRDRRKAA